MQLLVRRRANIQVLPNIAHIANDQGLHSIMLESGNEPCGGFVLNILDLVCQFSQLLLFRGDQFLAPTRAFLLGIDLLLQLG